MSMLKEQQERTAFIMLHDILGFDGPQIANRLGCDEKEIDTVMTSPLYIVERAEAIELFRRQAVRDAGDELAMAAHKAATFLASIPNNVRFKSAAQIRAAVEILDHVPQTSKTLRHLIRDERDKPFTDQQLERLAGQLRFDDKAQRVVDELPDASEFRQNLKQLLDVT